MLWLVCGQICRGWLVWWGVQHVPSKRMPECHGDSNIKGLDKYNMPCSRGCVFPSRRRSLSRRVRAHLRGFRASALGFEDVYWKSVYCGDAPSACPPGLPWRLRGVQHEGSGQVQHASFWRCHGARTSHGGASASDRLGNRGEDFAFGP